MAALTSFYINTVDRNDHSHSMRAQRIHDSDDDGVCDSNSLSATGSQQPTANSKQPPGGGGDDCGGDDGGDGYDDDDVIFMMTMTMSMTIAMTTSMVMMVNNRDELKMDYAHPHT